MPEVYELSQGLSDAIHIRNIMYGKELPPGTYGRGAGESKIDRENMKVIMNALKKITPNPQ